jgi:hypothetical protein
MNGYMNALDAILIVEGADISSGPHEGEPYPEEKVIEAWQLLIDTGLAWQLQGWFGRTAAHLIGEGICEEPDRNRPARAAIQSAYH